MKVRIKNKDNSKISLITLLIVFCVALSIGYSALSTTLKINGVANVDGMSFKIEFQNLSEASLTGNAVKITDPVISEDKTELKSYNVNFLDPGDSISYTFQIANNGTINAKLSEILKDTISCEGYGNAEQAAKDATNVCANLEYTLKYINEEEHFDDSGSSKTYSNDIEVNDVLNAGDVKDMILTLKYKSPVDGVTIEEPEDDVSISGLGISLTYSQVKTPTIGSNTPVVPDEPINTVSFAADSWDTIAKAVKAGKTENYKVGDTKEVDLGTYGKHNVRIANMSTPSECNQNGFSQSACGFVVEFTDIITTHNMNPSGEYNGTTYNSGWNKDGWPKSQMKTFIDNDIYNSLPQDLKSVIITTQTVSGHGKEDTNNFTSSDKLYLLSTAEIWVQDTSNTIDYDAARDKTRQLDYYKSNGVTTSSYAGAIKNNSSGTATSWWLRSANSNTNTGFYAVAINGNWSGSITTVARNTYGVSPAFRLEGPVEESINTVSFAEDSWDTIAKAVKAGNTSNYHVGDTKEVDLGTYGKHKVRIANMNTPNECKQEGFSQSACGFVVEFIDVITTHVMNPSGDYKGTTYNSGWNKDGWPKSQMKTFIDNDIYNSLPQELKSVIITTETVSGHGSEDTNNFTSIDKLYLLSTAEVWAQGTSNTIDSDTARDKTRRLDYYNEKGVTTNSYDAAIKNNSSGTATAWWWLRSARSNIYCNFYYVGGSGDWGNHGAGTTGGVSPAFRIG